MKDFIDSIRARLNMTADKSRIDKGGNNGAVYSDSKDGRIQAEFDALLAILDDLEEEDEEHARAIKDALLNILILLCATERRK